MPEKSLFSYKPFWAKRFGNASVLPMSPEEMDELGWDSCDIILVTGDAYIDHPSFGAAIIGRLLEAQGFRVGIIAQPDWQSTDPFKTLGKPNLFFGVTSGNMDSMVNRYTADKKRRSDDAYSPDNKGGLRPDRSVIVYSQRCKEAYPGIPIVLGGIEASLRRIAHYDYWQDKIRRSILLDAKADYLCFGNAERAIVSLAHALAGSRDAEPIETIRGLATVISSLPDTSTLIDASDPDTFIPNQSPPGTGIVLPSYQQVKDDSRRYAHSVRLLYRETNPQNARTLFQASDKRIVRLNPPAIPLTTEELDQLYALSFSRKPHPSYGSARFPALEMIRHSVNIMRGCFGGCSFCSLTIHEGRIIQSRSLESAVHEIETIRDTDPAFTGVISDVGGPSANMYRLGCKDPKALKTCRRLSCLYPKICPNLNTDHTALIELYQKVRSIPGIKKVNVASGVRYDLALCSKNYIKELVENHVGGYLKIAPEHTENQTLRAMMKPSIDCYHEFEGLFRNYSAQAGKEQYMIPYFIAGHPGSTDKDMLNLALWLKKNKFRPDQVQSFYPTPLTLASTSYATGLDMDDPKLLKTLYVPKGEKQRRVQKAFMRYHAPENQKLLVETLTKMGRADLIGFSKQHLVKPVKARRI